MYLRAVRVEFIVFLFRIYKNELHQYTNVSGFELLMMMVNIVIIIKDYKQDKQENKNAKNNCKQTDAVNIAQYCI